MLCEEKTTNRQLGCATKLKRLQKKHMKENLKIPSSFIQRNPWQKNTNPLWPATTFTLKRNIDKFNFPSRLPKDEMSRLLPLLSGAEMRFFSQGKAAFFE